MVRAEAQAACQDRATEEAVAHAGEEARAKEGNPTLPGIDVAPAAEEGTAMAEGQAACQARATQEAFARAGEEARAAEEAQAGGREVKAGARVTEEAIVALAAAGESGALETELAACDAEMAGDTFNDKELEDQEFAG